MKFNNTIDIIINDIDEIKNIIAGFKDKNRVPKIEFDLAMNKLRSIYEVLLMLDQSEKEAIQKTPPKNENIAVEDKSTSQPDIAIIETTETNEQYIDIETIADKFQSSPSRNEIIADKEEIKNVSSRLQSMPIDDIKKAIGINDKFLYTKELFKSNPSLYNQTIGAINNATSYNNAIEYLKSNFDWDFENEIVVSFLEIIKRKFPAT